MTHFIHRFLKGAAAPIQAFKYCLSHKTLWKYILAPFCLSLVIFGVFFYYAISYTESLVTFGSLITWGLGLLFDQPIGFLYNLLFYTLSFVSYVFVIGFIIFITFLFANLIALPFNALLAEKVMTLDAGYTLPHHGFVSWIKFNIRMLLIGLAKALVFLLIGLMLFIMGFIPILQIVSVILGALIIAFDCWDYALELRGMSLRQRFCVFYSHFWELSGFGMVVGLTFLLPGLNFFLLPIAVIGGTRIVHELNIGGTTGH